ncbi:MAG: Uma2 family endonuclease [Candidatus Competibacteraceae bacterium]
MKWQEVCEHRDLQNLPFKIELNEQGKVVMSPVKVYHSAFQAKISSLLDRLTGGYVLTECAIATRKGTKVTDVAWASRERFKKIIHEVECSIAPEVCIGILSSANTSDEIDEKKNLYFEKDCKEVWICSKRGKVTFYTHEGKMDKSNLIPGFPTEIDLFTETGSVR